MARHTADNGVMAKRSASNNSLMSSYTLLFHNLVQVTTAALPKAVSTLNLH
jgi:hypothetical protein